MTDAQDTASSGSAPDAAHRYGEEVSVASRTAAQRYLEDVSDQYLGSLSAAEGQSVSVVTHLLPDRPGFLSALSRHLQISAVFPIPYSTNQTVRSLVAASHPVIDLSLEDLIVGEAIAEHVGSQEAPHVHIEIGGYLAPHVGAQQGLRPASLSGIVEGTQAGYLNYMGRPSPGVPVIYLASSAAKEAESALVGPSCLFTLERVLRRADLHTMFNAVLVLGYGRVGRGVAHAARLRGLDVMVFDVDSSRRLMALGDGFRTPDRGRALKQADIVLAATGRRSWWPSDVELMKDDVMMASCSSKDLEFDVGGMVRLAGVSSYHREDVMMLELSGRRLHFVNSGWPINFLDGASLGPLLSLVQAEMIASSSTILAGGLPPGLQTPAQEQSRDLAAGWFALWVDPHTGRYRFPTTTSAAIECDVGC